MNHSDCDGEEFTKQQCQDLFKFFTSINKDSKPNKELKDTYNNFLKAFKLVAKSKVENARIEFA